MPFLDEPGIIIMEVETSDTLDNVQDCDRMGSLPFDAHYDSSDEAQP